jgi:dUTP pyrophosphatase
MNSDFKVMLSHEWSRLPKKVKDTDSGFDIFSCVSEVIPPKQWRLVKTGVHFDVPFGWEIQVIPKSTLALEKGITVLNAPASICVGCQDEVQVMIHNVGEFPFHIEPGDVIAKIVVRQVHKIDFEEVQEF